LPQRTEGASIVKTVSRLGKVALVASFGFSSLLVASSALAQGEGTPPAPAPAEPAPAPAPAPEPSAPSGIDAEHGVSVSSGGNAVQKKDVSQAEADKNAAEEKKLPFRGSTLLFDQSMTTQTAHLETSPQQSNVPLYEWWVSFRPRWYFSEHVYYWARFDYFKEFTNNQDNTYYREDSFGDMWNTLAYSTPLSKEGAGKNTKVALSGRVLLPFSKASRANNVYFTAGGGGSVSQKVPLAGEGAKWFNDVSLSLSASYSHPFSKATTAVGADQLVERQDTEGRSFASDQLRGGTLTAHQLLTVVGAELAITPKWSFGLDMIFINGWKYRPKDDVTVATGTGNVAVPRNSDSTVFTQQSWFIASTGYDILDELNVSLGYYNLANVVGPNGQRRGIVGGDNVWWSPDARVFLDLTANLDKIYQTVTGTKPKKTDAATNQPIPSSTKSRLRVQGNTL
jgi:hypothetical protein